MEKLDFAAIIVVAGLELRQYGSLTMRGRKSFSTRYW